MGSFFSKSNASNKIDTASKHATVDKSHKLEKSKQTLTTWKCENCDHINDILTDNCHHCSKCSQAQTHLSPIGEIMQSQQLVFDAFMRTEILNDLSQAAENIMTEDIIGLCNIFYTLHLIEIMQEYKNKLLQDKENHAWMEEDRSQCLAQHYSLQYAIEELTDNEEYFIAYKVCKMLLKCAKEQGWIMMTADIHCQLGDILIHGWHHDITNLSDADIEEGLNGYKSAIEITPDTYFFYFRFGQALSALRKYELAMINKVTSACKQRRARGLMADVVSSCKRVLA